MRVLRVRNVHEALPLGLSLLAECGIPSPSRAGTVLVAPVPVATIYEQPTERVLFWPERDANPFFHFFEGLWMLAGREDLGYLTQFVKHMENFSADGKTLNGAYGHRWRQNWGFDQIERIVRLMKVQPNTRRAVLTMFDPRRDLLDDESNPDVCCNTQAYFSSSYGKANEPNRLNMLVTCRSNDIIWGAYGANAVHFSMLHEYVASQLGLVTGSYTQLSNNFHAYEEIYSKTRQGALATAGAVKVSNPYIEGTVKPYPMVEDPTTWDRDLALFMEDPAAYGFINPFFAQVAKPLWWAHVAYKRQGFTNAFEILDQCKAEDWKLAAGEWLERRRAAYSVKLKSRLAAAQ